MRRSITLENTTTGEITSLETPFNEEQWCDALIKLGIPYDQNLWLDGYPPNIKVVGVESYTSMEYIMCDSNDPLLINAAESAWEDSYQSAVNAMVEYSGNYDLLEFTNICFQSKEISYYGYDEGEGYEGYGRERLRWEFENGEIPAFLEPYIDYDEYGRDCESESDDYVCDRGYLCDGGQIDENYYDRGEIISEVLDWDWDYEPDECTGRPQISQDALFNML